jgi:hypothetical protein
MSGSSSTDAAGATTAKPSGIVEEAAAVCTANTRPWWRGGTSSCAIVA